MRMYVANPTMFRVEFMYSIPESSKRLAQTIPPLTQVILAPNLTKEGVDSIVKQHEPYGFVPWDAATHSRKQGAFAGLCYRVDAPVPPTRIDALLRGNTDILDAQGKRMRQEAAISANEQLVKSVSHQSAMSPDQIDIGKVEIVVQQETTKTRDGGEVPTKEMVSEGFRIDAPQNVVVKGRGRR